MYILEFYEYPTILLSIQLQRMARQVGLRLEEHQISRLDAYCEKQGMDRTSVIRMAINQLLDGPAPSGSPVATAASSGGSTVDQQAREALTKLAAKVNLISAALEKKEARLAALEAEKTQPAAAPFSLDI